MPRFEEKRSALPGLSGPHEKGLLECEGLAGSLARLSADLATSWAELIGRRGFPAVMVLRNLAWRVRWTLEDAAQQLAFCHLPLGSSFLPSNRTPELPCKSDVARDTLPLADLG